MSLENTMQDNHDNDSTPEELRVDYEVEDDYYVGLDDDKDNEIIESLKNYNEECDKIDKFEYIFNEMGKTDNFSHFPFIGWNYLYCKIKEIPVTQQKSMYLTPVHNRLMNNDDYDWWCELLSAIDEPVELAQKLHDSYSLNL